jgi:hypothetical protein
MRGDARTKLSNGIDPSAARKAQQRSEESETKTFEMVARKWLAEMQTIWAASDYSKVEHRME